MGNGFSEWIASLVGQLPSLLIYVVGMVVALDRRAEQPRAARRVLLAFALLLINAVLLSGLSGWLINAASVESMSLESIRQLLTWLAFGQSALHAAALWLLLRTIFPAAETPAPGWLRRLIGAVIGLVVGVTLGAVLGNPVATALGVSDFEGAKGYFVAFVLIPLLALAGLIGGAVMGGIRRAASDP
jgi:hypothetical protein